MPASVWLILPTYDEASNIEPIVVAVLGALERACPDDHRILVVDDNSPDGTGLIADRLAHEHDAVEVLHRPGRSGLGPAYIAGFGHALRAGARYVIQMDADFSHDPLDIPRLLQAVRDGADAALGSRYVKGGGVADWSRRRRVVSRGGCWYAGMVLGVGVRDLTGGFKCWRADALQAIDLPTVRSQGYAFQVELTYRALKRGLRVREVPIIFRDRRRGRSKMSWHIALEAAWLVPRLRRSRPPERSRDSRGV
jgi:dolichol-phosphate mannosyltransferase